jgi:carboxypeptidase C (cathepsin A)
LALRTRSQIFRGCLKPDLLKTSPVETALLKSFFFFFFFFFFCPTSLSHDTAKVYSGYVSAGGLRQFFYWFIEAQQNPATAPLVFWYQGGPGCSGLAGLLTEHGPLVVNDAGDLDYNDVSWTKTFNVVYLEQPTFVGFSYSDDPADHACDDNKAARDNLVFVENWLNEFPQFKGRQTWFAGESYGGGVFVCGWFGSI